MKTKQLVESSVGIRTLESTARKIDQLLKTLPKECQTLRRRAIAATPEFSEGERADIAYVSTKTVDRDNESVNPAGLLLEEYRLNPIVLFNHDSSKPIGKALWIKSDSQGVKAKTCYANRPDNYAGEWLPDMVYELVKQGVLVGKSIGFLATLIREPSKEEKGMQEYQNCNCIIEEALLLEYSAVSVPCNPTALVEATAKGYAFDLLGIKRVGSVRRAAPLAIVQEQRIALPPINFDAKAIAAEVVERILARERV